MKSFIHLLIFILLSHISLGQVTFRTYYTKDNKETKEKENAFYYREITMAEGKNIPVEVVEKYTATDKFKLYGFYNNNTDKKFIGKKLQAYANGKIKAKEFFSTDGILIDTAQYYHPNGKLKLAYYYPFEVKNNKTTITDTLILVFRDSLGNTHLLNGDGYAELYNEDNSSSVISGSIEKGNFKNHKRIGEWNGSFQTGKYTFVELYDEKGNIISGITKDSLNREYPYTASNYMKEPQYPGGIIKLRQFIANNYKYTALAISNKVTGTVRVAFNVDAEGKMVDLKIDHDLGYGTGDEAIKVLKKAKTIWEPGVMRGIPVKVAYTLPVRLNLSH